jgi:plastocyanin domain-containing protein
LAAQRLLAPVASMFAGPSAILAETNPDGVQKITIQALNNGYSPRKLRVQSGQPVELTLQSNETYSCALSFVFKDFGIKTFLESTDSQTFTFTPARPGIYHFSCSMGMYTGVLEVI